LDTTFPHDYECKKLTEGPGAPTIPHYYYPGASLLGGGDGLLVEVQANTGRAWLATFAFGDFKEKGASGLFTTPDPGRLCAVSNGAGYWVSAIDPTRWESVTVYPIVDIRPIHAHGIIVFADFTRLVAYGPNGIKWATERLAFDSLRIVEVTGSSIRGEYTICGETRQFSVDLKTGTHQGGLGELY